MTLGAIGSISPILQTLESDGLSARKALLVQSDLDASIASATGLSGTKPDLSAVRGALDKKIAADVASGALSQKDAAAVSKTLDDMQASAGGGAVAAGSAAATDTAAAQGTGGAASGGAGGGGGGGSTAKTELSRTVIVSGSMKTTTITYTDGTTTTEVSASTGGDAGQTAGGSGGDAATAGSVEAEYRSKVQPGALVDALA